MNLEITKKQKHLSAIYLTYRLMSNLFFIGAVWLFFYRIFITDQQVGILDGMAFAIGLIAEVPSGALADKIGRRKIVMLGLVLFGGGFLIQGFGSSFAPFFVGQAVLMIGASLISGADEALFFGELNFDRNSLHWRKLVTRGSQLALVGTLLAVVVGGWLHTINPRIPWMLTGVSLIISTILIWSIKSPQDEKKAKNFANEVHNYLFSIKAGFIQFKSPKLALYLPIIITVQGLFYAAGWGLLRVVLLDRFHFDPFAGSLVIATSGLITIGILALMHKYAERMSEKRVLALISLTAAASLLLAIANIGVWGYFVILALYAGENVLYPFMSEVLNNRAEENQRATVLSVASFLRMMPYVVLAPIIGYLNTRSELQYFLVVWAILIVAAIMLYLMLKKKDSFVKLN